MKKSEKRLLPAIIILSVCICVFGISFNKTFAHTVKIDGTIQAELHIDPADDPSAGIPSRINLEFTDINHHFEISHCNCSVSIIKQGTTIFTKSFKDPGIDQADNGVAFTYVFPTADVYTLRVVGMPLSLTTPFQTFTISYDINVVHTANPASLSLLLIHHAFHIILFGIAILVGIIFTLVDYIFTKKKMHTQ